MQKLFDMVSRSPAIQDALAQERAAEEAQKTKARIEIIDHLASLAKDVRAVDEQIGKQQAVTDKAHDAYVEQAHKLGALNTRRAELQMMESSACRGLSDNGERILDEALTSLDGQMRWLADEVRLLQENPAMTADGQRERLAKIARFTGYHRAIKDALGRARKLSYARISPAELAAKVEALMTPLAGFKYTDD